MGLVESLLNLSGLDWLVPDFSTISVRQKHLQVAVPCCGRKAALHLLVDSMGVKMLGGGEWKTRKHDVDCRRLWCKAHLGINAQASGILAIEVTSNSDGDAPILPELLAQVTALIATAQPGRDARCVVSNYWANGALRATSAVMLSGFRCGLHCSTDLPIAVCL